MKIKLNIFRLKFGFWLSAWLKIIGKVKMRIQTAEEEGSSCVKLLTPFPIDLNFYILQSIPLFSKGISVQRGKMYSTYTYYFAYSILIFHTLNLVFCWVYPLEVSGVCTGQLLTEYGHEFSPIIISWKHAFGEEWDTEEQKMKTLAHPLFFQWLHITYVNMLELF